MKQAIFFPGIGYHCDKPLFYYGTKLCRQAQYEIHQLTYTNLSRSIPEASKQAYAQTEAQLAHVNWDACDEILFVSKSLGTAVAAAYAKRHHISCRNIYYTPLAETFDFANIRITLLKYKLMTFQTALYRTKTIQSFKICAS